MTSLSFLARALPGLGTFLCLFARTSAFLHTAPFVADRVIPRRARVGFAALFALGMTAARPDGVALASLPLVLPLELALGAACAFAVKLAVSAVESGGELIGLHLGLGFAGTVDPRSGEQSLPTKQIAWTVAGIAFFAMDGPGHALRVLAAPPPGTADPSALASVLIEHSGVVLWAAARFAAPVIIASIIGNVAFALASRAAPALNIFSVMFGGIVLIGGVALLITVPSFGLELSEAMKRGEDLMLVLAGGH